MFWCDSIAMLSANISLLESCIDRLEEQFSLSGIEQKNARNTRHFNAHDYTAHVHQYIEVFTAANTDALVVAVVHIVNFLNGDEDWEDKVGKMILRSFGNIDHTIFIQSIQEMGISDDKKRGVRRICNKIQRGHTGDYT